MSQQNSDNPFKGIVPFDESDQNRFFGRTRAIDSIMFGIENYRLTILRGPSGCGKTSLLRAGVLPRLRQFRVGADRERTGLPLIVRNWGAIRNSASTQELNVNAEFRSRITNENIASMEYLSQAIDNKAPEIEWLWKDAKKRQAFQKDFKDFKAVVATATKGELSPEEMISKISSKCNRVVLVFDQFEEILRSSKSVAEDTCKLIHRLLKQSGVKVVLSMRPEHMGDLNELRLIEIGVRSDDIRMVPLDEMGLEEAVLALNLMAQKNQIRIDDAFIKAVRDLRNSRARRHLGGDAHLFCCQAVVDEMWEALQKKGSENKRFDIAAFNEAFDANVDIAQPSDGTDLFALAIKSTFSRCFEPAPNEKRDMSSLHRHIAARAAPRLSSAGFKTPQGQSDLFDRIWGVSIKKDNPQRAFLLSEFEYCLKRLDDQHILKKYKASDDVIWELRHDRIGEPLIEWADEVRDSFEDCVAAPLGCSGITPIRAPSEGIGNCSEPRTISERRWLGCYVEPSDRATDPSSKGTARVHGLKFEKCNFAGTAFDSLEFRECEFERCKLDGALFKRCVFIDCKFEGSGLQPNDRGYTIGFLGCTFEGRNQFLNCDFAQLAFSGDSNMNLTHVAGDVNFTDVKLQLAWFGDAAPKSTGKFKFDKRSFMRWCSWDKSFQELISIDAKRRLSSDVDTSNT